MNGRQDQDSWIVSKRNEINNLLVYHYLEEIKNDEIEKHNPTAAPIGAEA